jgi:prevent-host-death family protein
MAHFIGSFEAKTHFAHLLDRAARGEEFIITRRGKQVARLIPLDSSESRRDAVQALEALQKGCRLDGLNWKELRDTGRK